MSVLIKRMEMPQDCFQCPFLHTSVHRYAVRHAYETYTCLRTGYRDDLRPKERMVDCPLVEVSPHGRLVDADAFIKENWYFVDRDFIDSRYDTTLRELIVNAPTIIPTEEEE